MPAFGRIGPIPSAALAALYTDRERRRIGRAGTLSFFLSFS